MASFLSLAIRTNEILNICISLMAVFQIQDQNICSHYSRYGICKFGPSCKFDHSIQPASSIGSSDDQNTAFGNSVTQEAARMAESGNGSDISVEQPV